MSTAVMPFDYQGQAVSFNADGWLNATEAAARFGKRPNDWLALPSTKEYLAALAEMKPEVKRFSVTRKGGNTITRKSGNGAGTWLHPDLAVTFARWLDVRFSIWCDQQINSLLRGEGQSWAQARQQLSATHAALCDALALNCMANGKTAEQRHFVNEARLINSIIAQLFEGRCREQLTAPELRRVARVEGHDIYLLAQGLPYAERKTLLLAYAAALPTQHLKVVA